MLLIIPGYIQCTSSFGVLGGRINGKAYKYNRKSASTQVRAVLIKICFAFTGFKLPPNSENREHLKKISGVLFVYWPITIKFRIRKQTLLPNSENPEHLKNFRSVDCVLANYNKVQDTQANLTAKLRKP